MSLSLKVLMPTEINEVLDFELKRLVETIPDEMERSMASWNAKWRKEALEHYLPMGWSFVAREGEGEIRGYFIGQPLLFFDGQTQSLWIEHLQASSLLARDSLTELARKLAREKHFQRVYFPAQASILNAVKPFGPVSWGPDVVYVKTTKA